MSVDFITFCCPKDIHRLHMPQTIEDIVSSHRYGFNEVYIIYQRCRALAETYQLPPDWVKRLDRDWETKSNKIN